MNNKPEPQRDPVRAYQRAVIAARRIGPDKQCTCGELRPEALIAGSDPRICQECQRRKNGTSTKDQHHVAGRANAPNTLPTAVNNHAQLSEAQRDWPRDT